MKFNESFRCVI